MSATGKIANVISRRLDPFARFFGRLHARLYRRTGGRFLPNWMGAPSLLLTVRGRKSGQPRSVMVLFTRHGDDYLVVGSNGGNPSPPSWFLNLRDAGEADVQIRGEQFKVKAHVADDAERAEVWPIVVKTYKDFDDYQSRTDRQIPVVVLTPIS